MCLQPKNASRRARINTDLRPPGGFVTAAMNFAVMSSAKGNRELIADLTAKGRRLCKTEMMRIGGTPAANQAWLLGDGLHMLPVSNSTGHRQRQDRLIDTRRTI
jgi:hypothetical protein